MSDTTNSNNVGDLMAERRCEWIMQDATVPVVGKNGRVLAYRGLMWVRIHDAVNGVKPWQQTDKTT